MKRLTREEQFRRAMAKALRATTRANDAACRAHIALCRAVDASKAIDGYGAGEPFRAAFVAAVNKAASDAAEVEVNGYAVHIGVATVCRIIGVAP